MELLIRNNACFIMQKWEFAKRARQLTSVRLRKSLVERWEAQVRQELGQYFQIGLFFATWWILWIYFPATEFVSTSYLLMFRTVIVSICLSAWTVLSENIRFLLIPFSFKKQVSIKGLSTYWLEQQLKCTRPENCMKSNFLKHASLENTTNSRQRLSSNTFCWT